MEERCVSYRFNNFEYIFPSPAILSTLCLSYDRTELFIISVIRLIIWVMIYYTVNQIIDYESYPIIKYVMYTMIGINVLYIAIVVARKPVFSLGANQTVSMFEADRGNLTGSIPFSIN